jgi:hypothetical protein
MADLVAIAKGLPKNPTDQDIKKAVHKALPKLTGKELDAAVKHIHNMVWHMSGKTTAPAPKDTGGQTPGDPLTPGDTVDPSIDGPMQNNPGMMPAKSNNNFTPAKKGTQPPWLKK